MPTVLLGAIGLSMDMFIFELPKPGNRHWPIYSMIRGFTVPAVKREEIASYLKKRKGNASERLPRVRQTIYFFFFGPYMEGIIRLARTWSPIGFQGSPVPVRKFRHLFGWPTYSMIPGFAISALKRDEIAS